MAQDTSSYDQTYAYTQVPTYVQPYGYSVPPISYQQYPTYPPEAYQIVQPQQQQQHHQQQLVSNQSHGSQPSNALWIGDLDSWMDENYVYGLFAHTGEIMNVKVIRDKTTQMSVGYGFVYFRSVQGAERVMQTMNGTPVPNSNKRFKLNWAVHGQTAKSSQNKTTPTPPVTTTPIQTQTTGERGGEDPHALFVGDLAADVTDQLLLQTFQYYYPSVYNARVVNDPRTGQSKGFGFIYFHDEADKIKALTEMQGFYISYKPIKLNFASKKNSSGTQAPSQTVPAPIPPPGYVYPYPYQTYPYQTYPYPYVQPGFTPMVHQPAPKGSGNLDASNDPTNTTLFVGGIDSSITPEMIRAHFSPHGEIQSIRIPVGKACAFVEFKSHDEANNAISKLGNTTQIGQSQARVYWGRPPKYPPSQQSSHSNASSSSSTSSSTTSSSNTSTNSTNSSETSATTAETSTESSEKVKEKKTESTKTTVAPVEAEESKKETEVYPQYETNNEAYRIEDADSDNPRIELKRPAQVQEPESDNEAEEVHVVKKQKVGETVNDSVENSNNTSEENNVHSEGELKSEEKDKQIDENSNSSDQ